MKTRALWLLFAYTLLVILWGAWVRISHSGDGCGDSWPLCQGEFIPQADSGKTWVEYSHRAMSGIYGLLVAGLWLAFRRDPDARVRRAAHLTLFFTITEALLGAKLVIFGLVSDNQTWGRTAVMSLHQLNSLALSGSSFVWAYATTRQGLEFRARSALGAILFGVIAVTGAWAALSTTLFPTQDLWEGLVKDFSPESHHLLRLRIMHPLSALLGGGGLAVFLSMKAFEDSVHRRVHLETAAFILGAILFGVATLFFLAPVWMKLTHLLMAHLLWAALLRWMLAERAVRA